MKIAESTSVADSAITEPGADDVTHEDGVLTVYFWHPERDVEAEGMWWLDDLPWPTEES
jgi:hypothetical protein